jgi:tRNA modification GTPase
MPDLDKRLIAVANKTDRTPTDVHLKFPAANAIPISAKEKLGLDALLNAITSKVNLAALQEDQTIVTNIRHIEALKGANYALNEVLVGLDQLIPGDLLAIDVRRALFFLGEITGQITTDDLLANIFSKFCIGK